MRKNDVGISPSQTLLSNHHECLTLLLFDTSSNTQTTLD